MDEPTEPNGPDEKPNNETAPSGGGEYQSAIATSIESQDLSEEKTQSESTDSPVEHVPVVRGRYAVILIVAMIVLADFTIYKAAGYAGPAVFLCVAPFIVCFGIPRRVVRGQTLLIWSMLFASAYRLSINGNATLLLSACWLLFALAVALRGRLAHMFGVLLFAVECLPGGGEFLSALHRNLRERTPGPIDDSSERPWADVFLPVFAAVLFGGVFVMANPDVVLFFSGQISRFADLCLRFARQFTFGEVVFWGMVAWLTGGILRPTITRFTSADSRPSDEWGSERTPMYGAFRNTLITLIGLFAVYLIFESRSFYQGKPSGFTYSSYAHEGAAWLTIALAMATALLSLIFRGVTMIDPRLPALRRLARVWTVLNLLLAVAVYNRLCLYVGYNGMTRMRVIGFLGITSVVVGFAFVLIKIYRHRSFTWLIQRQLWVVALAMFCFSLLPVDSVVHSYNVSRIMDGNPAPVVQITAHPLDDECLPVLIPLCRSENTLVKEGIQGMLTLRQRDLQTAVSTGEELGWTAWQRHKQNSLDQLRAEAGQWNTFASRKAATDALTKLASHARTKYW